jgi:hypothetical protein
VREKSLAFFFLNPSRHASELLVFSYKVVPFFFFQFVSYLFSPSFQVWQPGVDALEDGEELQFDPEAYNYIRGFGIDWSCLR